MKQLGMADVDMVDIISEAQSFMSMCYNVKNVAICQKHDIKFGWQG